MSSSSNSHIPGASGDATPEPSGHDSRPFAITDPIALTRWRKAQAFLIDDQSGKGTFSAALMKDLQWDREFTELAIYEYKKFMFLRSLFPDKNFLPSVHVDTVWHLHLLYTVGYQRFCREALDTDFIHHDPSKGGVEEKEAEQKAYSETLAAYVETFGIDPPVEIWGYNLRARLLADGLCTDMGRLT
jgi:hypothetical protein